MDDIDERLRRLDLGFDEFGLDPFGLSRRHLAAMLRPLAFLYRRYFQVRAFGLEHVPDRGRAMLVGNHSGGVALDAAMVLAALLLDKEPPRLAHAMAEKFIASLPFASTLAARCGQLTGLPEIAEKLLEAERLLLVFPEGARGTAKLHKERWSLVDFGTGFVRLATKTKTPVVPFGFIGGGDAIPTIANLYRLGRAVGAPYLPVTPWLLPIPRPVRLEVHFGKPIVFSGTGSEDDELVTARVDEVKRSIAGLIEEGRAHRRKALGREP